LSEKSKEVRNGKHTLLTVEKLIEWIGVVDNEIDGFIKKLHEGYLELEKKFVS